jgi:hypothetical protein
MALTSGRNAVKWRQISQQPRSYVLIFNTGDELAKGLKDFATEQNLADASFKVIGALASVRLAWFNPEKKEYQTSVELKEAIGVALIDWRCGPARPQAYCARTCRCGPVRRHNSRWSFA